jgi:hypothetical protein
MAKVLAIVKFGTGLILCFMPLDDPAQRRSMKPEIIADFFRIKALAW